MEADVNGHWPARPRLGWPIRPTDTEAELASVSVGRIGHVGHDLDHVCFEEEIIDPSRNLRLLAALSHRLGRFFSHIWLLLLIVVLKAFVIVLGFLLEVLEAHIVGPVVDDILVPIMSSFEDVRQGRRVSRNLFRRRRRWSPRTLLLRFFVHGFSALMLAGLLHFGGVVLAYDAHLQDAPQDALSLALYSDPNCSSSPFWAGLLEKFRDPGVNKLILSSSLLAQYTFPNLLTNDDPCLLGAYSVFLFSIWSTWQSGQFQGTLINFAALSDDFLESLTPQFYEDSLWPLKDRELRSLRAHLLYNVRKFRMLFLTKGRRNVTAVDAEQGGAEVYFSEMERQVGLDLISYPQSWNFVGG